MSEPQSEQYTIDELAQRTGLTTRNIRAYQSRGLIEAPERRGRTGYYGPEHVERLELIRQMREEGLALDLIERMLEFAGGSRDSLSFARTLFSQFNAHSDEEPPCFTVAELAQIFQSTDFTLVARAERDGLWRQLDDGRVEVVNRQLFEAGQLLVEMGVPANEMLDALEAVNDKVFAIAKLFRDIFVGNVWDEFERAGRPVDRWERLGQLLERSRAAADEVTIALYRQAIETVMSEEIEQKLSQLGGASSNA
jgi:DNA-binding transcriptional MerR regulator